MHEICFSIVRNNDPISSGVFAGGFGLAAGLRFGVELVLDMLAVSLF